MVLNSLMLAGGGFVEFFVVVLSSVIVLPRSFPVLTSLLPVDCINEPVQKFTGNLADVRQRRLGYDFLQRLHQ